MVATPNYLYFYLIQTIKFCLQYSKFCAHLFIRDTFIFLSDRFLSQLKTRFLKVKYDPNTFHVCDHSTANSILEEKKIDVQIIILFLIQI